MNARERFLGIMSFEPVGRTLCWEEGYWAGAVRRWYREGLELKRGISPDTPDGDPVKAVDVNECLGLDELMRGLPLDVWFEPGFQAEIIEDHGDWVLQRTKHGVVERNRKDHSGFPGWVRGPVQTRDDWERIKAERLRPTLEGRLPDGWLQLLEQLSKRTYPLSVGGHPAGFFGSARHLLGQERVLTASYDEPELLRDVVDYLGDFWVAIYDQVLDRVDVDACIIWEDMCYKNGHLISPATFREYMLPNYQKVTACLRDHGVNVIIVDSDGDVHKLLPLFIEGGVTAVLPCEVNAGMDVVELRQAFPRLGLLGGVDKTRVAAGPEAIDQELESKIPFMLQHGGYIPTIDHQVPSDVSWENFRYYRTKLNRMIVGGSDGEA